MRQKISLDRDWRFHLGDFIRSDYPEVLTWFRDSDSEPMTTSYDDSSWQAVNVPHDWVIDTYPDQLVGAKTGFVSGGVGWYRKSFHLSESDRGKALWVEFDGVYRDSTVWLNGVYLGHHPSGYTSFRYDLSDAAQYGDENVLVVRVGASRFEGWWYYEGAGLYRHVWLVKADPLHVAHWGTQVLSEVDLSSKATVITANITVDNECEEAVEFLLSSQIMSPDGVVVATIESQALLGPGTTGCFTQQAQLENLKLWSLEKPHLYRLETVISKAGEKLDSYDTSFGLRTVAFDPDKGFFLNGKPIKIKGTCNHQDHSGVGTALPDRLHEHRVRKLLALGCNAYRSAHHPPAPELLDACDRLGMLFLDETRTFGSSAQALDELQSMIRRDRNHPSIILWGLGNEESLVPYKGGASAARVVARMKRLAHKLDPSRPVTIAMNKGFDGPVSNLVEVVGFNYHTELYDQFHQQHPETPVVGTELTCLQSTRGTYEDDLARPRYHSYDRNEHYMGRGHELSWRAVAERAFVAGAFVWTGFDYHGEALPEKGPSTASHFGLLDLCGFPKDCYYYYQAAWTEKPVLHIFPHWNWPGREGEPISIWCYSNCNRVELALNGRSLGAQELAPNSHLEWTVPYEPGVLLARGFRGGALVATTEVVTTDAPHALRLEPDRTSLKADGSDVAVIAVSVVDAEGRVVPTADNEVNFTIEGSGRLIGVANGDPSSRERERGNRRRAFRGRCVAIVQATEEPGAIALSTTSLGLRPAKIELVVGPG